MFVSLLMDISNLVLDGSPDWTIVSRAWWDAVDLIQVTTCISTMKASTILKIGALLLEHKYPLPPSYRNFK